MGLTHVTVTVRNPADLDRTWESLFLVLAGATDSMVPGGQLRDIGIEPMTQRSYELADGREQTYDVGVARIEFLGDIVGASVIFGPDDAEPILGVTALPVGRHRSRSPHRAVEAATRFAAKVSK